MLTPLQLPSKAVAVPHRHVWLQTTTPTVSTLDHNSFTCGKEQSGFESDMFSATRRKRAACA